MLFILFCFALLETKIKLQWKIKTAVVPFIAAFVPCGPFFIDRWLKSSDRSCS